jgi:hypothetical protein
MYNRYLDPSPVSETIAPADEPAPRDRNPTEGRPAERPRPAQHPPERLLGELSNSLGDLLGGVTKHFSLGDVDTGDILLVLIILFLFLEGDDLELVITLGLMLLLGLGDD